MSPSWRDELRLVLGPDRLVAVRLSRGLRPRVLWKQAHAVEGSGTDAGPALATLAELLRRPEWQRANAVVLLSSRFATYQLLPWTDAALDRAEEAARARRACVRAHGEAAASLELRASGGGFGKASVVSGVEQALLAGIRESFAASTLKLVSIQPYLMAAFNQCRRELVRGAHWFVVVESGTLCTALVADGEWRSLRTRRVGDDWRGELLPALRRQGLAHDGAEQVTSVLVLAPDEAQAPLPKQAGWSLRRLALPSRPDWSADRDRAFGLALAGAS